MGLTMHNPPNKLAEQEERNDINNTVQHIFDYRNIQFTEHSGIQGIYVTCKTNCII